MIKRPPTVQNIDRLPDEFKPIAIFIEEAQDWMTLVYNKLRFIDAKDIAITTSDSAPTGGEDGDIHIRRSGASTALYLNIDGTFSAFTNP